MDYLTLKSTILSLVASLVLEDRNRSSVRHLLDYGETAEAMDVLVAVLVRGDVPITPSQHSTVRTLMGEFDLDPEDRRIYSYLGDSEMLDRMNIIEERDLS